MLDRRGSGNTNAYIILTIMTFYVSIAVILGLIGTSYQATKSPEAPPEPSLVGFLGQISTFFSSMFFTISELPAWANTLLFLPLGLTLFYILISFLRGSS
jgi:hypothetical protein